MTERGTLAPPYQQLGPCDGLCARRLGMYVLYPERAANAERHVRSLARSAIAAVPYQPRVCGLVWKSTPFKGYLPRDIDRAWERATADPTRLDQAQPGIYPVEGNRLRLAWGS